MGREEIPVVLSHQRGVVHYTRSRKPQEGPGKKRFFLRDRMMVRRNRARNMWSHLMETEIHVNTTGTSYFLPLSFPYFLQNLLQNIFSAGSSALNNRIQFLPQQKFLKCHLSPTASPCTLTVDGDMREHFSSGFSRGFL